MNLGNEERASNSMDECRQSWSFHELDIALQNWMEMFLSKGFGNLCTSQSRGKNNLNYHREINSRAE
jgi:hypothetical protein